jgi:hypothetical protein
VVNVIPHWSHIISFELFFFEINNTQRNYRLNTNPSIYVVVIEQKNLGMSILIEKLVTCAGTAVTFVYITGDIIMKHSYSQY